MSKRYSDPSRRAFLKTLAAAGAAGQFTGLFRDVWADVPANVEDLAKVARKIDASRRRRQRA